MIKREGNGFTLYTKDGSRKLGKHKSRKKAMAQEYAIKMNKKDYKKEVYQLLIFDLGSKVPILI